MLVCDLGSVGEWPQHVALRSPAVLKSRACLGGVPEWLKGADCKSVGLRLRWFESSLLHQANLLC